MKIINDEIMRELEKRGTAELHPNGVVNQITQALGETADRADFIIFGERQQKGIIPIEQACAKCDFWKGKFETTKLCQRFQGGDAESRGFKTVICPEQFKEATHDSK